MPRSSGYKRYPAELKAQLVTYATQRPAAGAGFATIGEGLGLGHKTVRQCCSEGERGSALAAVPRAVVPVEVVAEERSSLAIVSPSGFRLEGLDMAGRGNRCVAGAAMILGTSRSVRGWAYPATTELRKGDSGLFGLMKTKLGRDPMSGDSFLFVHCRRNGCEVPGWDGTELCIVQKRLEQGRLAARWWEDGQTVRSRRASSRSSSNAVRLSGAACALRRKFIRFRLQRSTSHDLNRVVNLRREKDIRQLRRIALTQKVQIDQLLRVLTSKSKELEA